MSDRFYGAVRFPAWATKYLPKDADDCCMELEPSSKVSCFEEEEARNGKPWLVAELDRLGIPYDLESSEYFEYKAEKTYFRFRAGGKSEDLVVTDGDELVEAKDIVSIIDKGNNLAAIRRWCQDRLDLIAPLTPPLEEITETDYLEWTKNKAQVWQDNLQRVVRGDQVPDLYELAEPPILSDNNTACQYNGKAGLWFFRDVPLGRIVSGEALDVADRAFQYARFMLLGRRQVGAFLDLDGAVANDDDMCELAVTIKDRLDGMVGGAI
ncbi:hypothetical protein [Acidithiobacillus ferrianus]|uniref:hypothetical protein n=1 Tax=Acidithiobacillus ferrianus TaxID=2678518 RepID=UPI0034E6085B